MAQRRVLGIHMTGRCGNMLFPIAFPAEEPENEERNKGNAEDGANCDARFGAGREGGTRGWA